MINYSISLLLLLLTALTARAEQLFVDFKTGNDANPGTKGLPLRTIREAARRVNMHAEQGGDTILLSAGVHLLTETVLFSNSHYTADDRLVIRAEVLPDDPGWTPQNMPIIVSVVPTVATGDGEEARGLEIETSHVTIEGLRFTGGPDYYYIDGRQARRTYPIWRDGSNLDDLLVMQCLFAGNIDVLPIRVAIIANGHGLVVDHCVFFNCENAVVFGNAEGGTSHHNAMRYCLVYAAHYGGLWTTANTGEDFDFHHNIIADSRAGWIGEDKQMRHYRIHDCILSGNTNLTANGRNSPVPADFLQMENVQTTGSIVIEKDQGRNNYLQLKDDSFGSTLKAGLFKVRAKSN